ncbi:hypothetical protein E2C01_004979 [Portunus trituberculatus]|uniref:Uncharacterized protein n=1 Tax=Portunus trituberculatus TaxID=210409 RepID=A0A5B7CSS6_PORTR|nr:hypothetical protein [Portunus trituberculatus]
MYCRPGSGIPMKRRRQLRISPRADPLRRSRTRPTMLTLAMTSLADSTMLLSSPAVLLSCASPSRALHAAIPCLSAVPSGGAGGRSIMSSNGHKAGWWEAGFPGPAKGAY